MSKEIIVDGAMLEFPANFGVIKFLTPIPPYRVTGTGEASINDNKVCQLGDETKVEIEHRYTTSTATIPGKVKITITKVETASYVFSSKPVIVGPKWTALCTVTEPAEIPQPSPADPVPEPMDPVTEDVPFLSNPNDFVTVA